MVPRGTLAAVERKVRLNRLKLANFVEFVKSTVDSLSAEEPKNAKKKTGKKEAERLLAAKEELLRLALQRVEEANKQAEIECSETTAEALLEDFPNGCFDDRLLPGTHHFDIARQTYRSLDMFGRPVATSVTDCRPIAQRLTFSSLVPGEGDRSAYDEFFQRHSAVVGGRGLAKTILRTSGATQTRLLTKDEIIANWPDSKETACGGVYRRLTAVEEVECFERAQGRLRRRVDPSLTIDVCRLREKEAELPPNQRLLRTFVAPICQPTGLEAFKAALSEHTDWSAAQGSFAKFFGFRATANQSAEEFSSSLRRKVRCLEALAEGKGVEGSLAGEEPAPETPVDPAPPSQLVEVPPPPGQRDSRRQSVAAAGGEGKGVAGSHKKSSKQKSLAKSSSLLQELSPRYVTNYFETLEGRQYSINNPPPSSPVALSPSEQRLIAELKQSAADNPPCEPAAPNASRGVPETKASQGGSGPREAGKGPKPVELMSLNERKRLLKATLQAEDEASRKYHEAKSPKFDVYGDARARLPHVPSLYKQESQGNEDSLLEKDAAAKAECFVRPSTLHRFRNYAPHHLLFQSMDKGWKNDGKLRFEGPETGFVCEATRPESGDIIIYPSQVDFGRLAEGGCYELKFTLVNVDWVAQKVVVRPPIETPAISVICSQESFAPGLKKTVFVQVDARKMARGLFVHNVLVETRYKAYKVRVSGVVADGSEKAAGEGRPEDLPVLASFAPQQPAKPVQFKVRNVLGDPSDKSKTGSGVGMTSEHLPRLFYDKNFSVS